MGNGEPINGMRALLFEGLFKEGKTPFKRREMVLCFKLVVIPLVMERVRNIVVTCLSPKGEGEIGFFYFK